VWKLAKLKPTAEQLKGEVELQLSQRRFILEAVQTAVSVIQVPMVSAFVWYYLSRTNPTLGLLNKAILTLEVTPLIGDIKFPEGVLLGAAMESTEDLMVIMDKQGIKIPSIPDKEDVATWIEEAKSAAEEAAIDTGAFVADILMPKGSNLRSCEELNERLFQAHLAATGRIMGPEGVMDNPEWAKLDALSRSAIASLATINFGFELKALKDNGCPRPKSPYYVSEKVWSEA